MLNKLSQLEETEDDDACKLSTTCRKVEDAHFRECLEHCHVSTPKVQSRVVHRVVATSLLIVKTSGHLESLEAGPQQVQPH